MPSNQKRAKLIVNLCTAIVTGLMQVISFDEGMIAIELLKFVMEEVDKNPEVDDIQLTNQAMEMVIKKLDKLKNVMN